MRRVLRARHVPIALSAIIGVWLFASFSFNWVGAADDSTLLAVLFNNSTGGEYLGRIDPATGAVTLIGDGIPQCCAVTQSSAVYHSGVNRIFVNMSKNDATARMLGFDVNDGSVSESPPLPGNERINYMGYDPKTQHLVGIGFREDRQSEGVGQIDHETGAIQWIGTGVDNCCVVNTGGFGLDADNRRLYAVMSRFEGDTAYRIFTFDIDSGELIKESTLPEAPWINYLAFEESSGRLLGLVYDPVRERELLAEIDPNTGGIRTLGDGANNCCTINAQSAAFDQTRRVMTVTGVTFDGVAQLVTWDAVTGQVLYRPQLNDALYVVNFPVYVANLPPPPTPSATPLPLLSIEKSAPSWSHVDASITYILTATNTSLGAAKNVVVVDELPALAQPEAISEGGVFTQAMGGTATQATWRLAELQANSSRTVTFTVSATQTLVNKNYFVQWGQETRYGSEGVVTLIGRTIVTDTVTVHQSTTITSADAAVAVDIPAGAVVSPVDIFLTSEPVRESGFAGPTFVVEANDASGSPVTSFALPLTLTIRYKDEDWQNGGVANEDDLNVFYWTGATWRAVLPCDGCSRDVAENLFIVKVDHLTLFSIQGRAYLYLSTVEK